MNMVAGRFTHGRACGTNFFFFFCDMLKKANVASEGVEYHKEVIFRPAEQNLPES